MSTVGGCGKLVGCDSAVQVAGLKRRVRSRALLAIEDKFRGCGRVTKRGFWCVDPPPAGSSHDSSSWTALSTVPPVHGCRSSATAVI